MRRIKCWVVYNEEYPEGIVFPGRGDALEASANIRESGAKAYTRVKYFTKEELKALPKLDF